MKTANRFANQIVEALQRVQENGHRMRDWETKSHRAGRLTVTCTCKECDGELSVTHFARETEIEIAGPVLAMECV